MRGWAGTFGLLFVIAGAWMMWFGYFSQRDLYEDSARRPFHLGMSCEANRDRPEVQECTWGRWTNGEHTDGDEVLPTVERAAELHGDLVVIGAALFVSGAVLTAGVLVAGSRTRAGAAVAPPQQFQSHQPGPAWPPAGH